MSDEAQKSGRSGDYVVGYKRPPEATRFQKGRSGNPNGRPKGTRNLRDDLADELREMILIREGEQSKKVSKQRAFLKSLIARALKGDARAASTLLNTMMRVFNIEEPSSERHELTADERGSLEVLEARLFRRTASPAPESVAQEAEGENGEK